MKEAEKLIKEYGLLIGKNDAESETRKEEIVGWLMVHGTQEDKDKAADLIRKNLQRIDTEILTIRQRLGDLYNLLPVSYIAKHYFGKSAAWLYQRINGNPIRGKVYTLNAEQKEIFNQAIQDLAKFYGSFRI